MANETKTLKHRCDNFVNQQTESNPEYAPILKVGFIYGAMEALEHFNNKQKAYAVNGLPSEVALLKCVEELKQLHAEAMKEIDDYFKRRGRR